MTVGKFFKMLEFCTMPIYVYGFEDSDSDDDEWVLIGTFEMADLEAMEYLWRNIEIECFEIDSRPDETQVRIYTTVHVPRQKR